jgi:predicted dithiol-disulfide oxidoreductase (DUF899 family)
MRSKRKIAPGLRANAVEIDKSDVFEAPNGKASLLDLF